MSDYRTLQRWISDGESVNLDFKTSITSRHKIAKNLVAFANCRGGKLVVGIEDKGYLVGVDVDGEQYELDKAAQEFCFPAIELDYSKFQHQGKFVLIAEIHESTQKPHFAFNKNKTAKQIYIRVADECIIPPKKISEMLEKGEMNFTYRTAEFQRTKRELLSYLKVNANISVPQFAERQKLSEHNALRMLVDYLFEGIIRFDNKAALTFAKV